jgi:hypothetical protein
MPLQAVREIWEEVKRYISTVDRGEAAETVVSILIDHDYDADDIRAAFKGDSDIKRSLESYNNNTEESEYDDEEEYEEEYNDEDY